MGKNKKREGFSEEFDYDDLGPEDYERLMDLAQKRAEKAQKRAQIANLDDSGLTEQDNDDRCM